MSNLNVSEISNYFRLSLGDIKDKRSETEILQEEYKADISRLAQLYVLQSKEQNFEILCDGKALDKEFARIVKKYGMSVFKINEDLANAMAELKGEQPRVDDNDKMSDSEFEKLKNSIMTNIKIGKKFFGQ